MLPGDSLSCAQELATGPYLEPVVCCSGLALSHLLTHALFKTLFFICAVGVIHSVGDSQDIRFMGGLSIYMPFTFSSLTFKNRASYI